ncbi:MULTISPECIES: hypothetical protein [Streptomyces]|uniref:hypothetical protein n=1 Tax=Streptomyces TaxID=1883 RepID=UPI0004AAD4E4|nr:MULTISPECIES: hypothetical protein [Streptomyces]
MGDHGTTAKTDQLKTSFGKFFDLKEMVAKVNKEAEHINDLNLTVGGSDEIGKQYHSQVDEGTRNLTDLLLKIHSTMAAVGENGEALADTLDKANDHAGEIAKF